MTPPRRNIGGAPPRGQVAAVMLRALAAELSDPARFRRAVGYARDGAVLDIEITAGVVRVLVRGSRFEPYQAHVWVDPVDADVHGLALVPRRDEVVADCTCPDDSPFPGAFCKHALAALLVLADEVTVDPEVLTTWRADTDGDDDERRSRTRRAAATDGWHVGGDVAAEPVDVLATSITLRGTLPEPRQVPSRLPVAMARHDELSDLVADVLSDALATLRTR
jgi:uncharacterized Zn finger protein